MSEVGVSACTIPTISHRFGTSIQATARRIAEVLPYDIAVGLWATDERKSHFVPKWYLNKAGAIAADYVIKFGRPGSECFTEKAVRGWRWVPLQGHMDKYFVDICPLSGVWKSWLVMVIFSDAPQHVMATVSKGKPRGADTQLHLMDE